MKIVLIILIGLFYGCGLKVRDINSYTIDSSLEVKNIKKYQNKILRVAYPKSIDGKITQRIYFKRGDIKSYYQNSRFSEPLNRMILKDVIFTLKRAHIFKDVIDYASLAKEDLTLEIVIDRFIHDLDGGSWAIVELEARVIDSNGKLVKSKTFFYKIATPSVDAKGFIKAAKKALRRFNQDLIRWI
ncbi:MAG: hypothetical protein GXO02_06295 [Epsilonproteobacteria bacterium]|nr:hypothetical protein [Campylobacterota bacterium]